jgi:hypothetical protein
LASPVNGQIPVVAGDSADDAHAGVHADPAGPYASGAGLAGAFTAINQTTTNTMVTANL